MKYRVRYYDRRNKKKITIGNYRSHLLARLVKWYAQRIIKGLVANQYRFWIERIK